MLDVIAVPQCQLHESFRQNELYFCETDGIFLPWFPKLDLCFTIPKTKIELISLLNRRYQLWLNDISNIPDLTQEQAHKQLWKRTFRAIYSLAILSGAPYEQN